MDPLSYFSPEDLSRGAHRALVVGWTRGLGLLFDLLLLWQLAFGRLGRALFERLPAGVRQDGPLSRVLGVGWSRVALFLFCVAALRGFVEWPFVFYRGHLDAHALGLSHESLPSFLGRYLRDLVIVGAALGLLGVGLGAVRRRWPRRWWWSVGLAGALALVADTVAEPFWLRLDFDETPLAEGPLETRLQALAARHGRPLGAVTVIDASRYGTRANAFVTGLGPSQRIVLTDTLLERGEEAVVGAVAHELGHRREERLPRRLLLSCVALVAFLGFFELCLRWARRRGAPSDAHALVFALAAVGALGLILAPVRGVLSRAEEREADTLELSERADLDAYIADQVALVRANALNPSPGRLGRLFSTHPSAAERIGRALEAGVERGPPSDPKDTVR